MRKSDLLIYKQWGEKPKVLTKKPLLPDQEVPLLLKRAQEGDKRAQEKLILSICA